MIIAAVESDEGDVKELLPDVLELQDETLPRALTPLLLLNLLLFRKLIVAVALFTPGETLDIHDAVASLHFADLSIDGTLSTWVTFNGCLSLGVLNEEQFVEEELDEEEAVAVAAAAGGTVDDDDKEKPACLLFKGSSEREYSLELTADFDLGLDS